MYLKVLKSGYLLIKIILFTIVDIEILRERKGSCRKPTRLS